MRLMLASPRLFAAIAQEAAKAENPGERWITVHPHGKDEPGYPVLIKVDPNNPRVGRIIGGAGGKLNYVQVHLKTPEEYRREASVRRAEKRARAEAMRKGEIESPKKAKSLEKLKADREKTEQEIVKKLAEVLGWGKGDEVIQPDQDATRGLDDKARDKLRKEHLKSLLRDANRAGEAAKELLRTDARARAEAGLGELSIKTDDTRLGAEDLLTDNELKEAPGYQKEASGVDNDDLRAERVRALENRLKDATGGGAPEDAARLAQRLARYRPIEQHEIETADPSMLCGWARQVWQRYDRLDNLIAARQDIEKKRDGEVKTEHPMDDGERAELDGLGKLVAGMPMSEALNNAHSSFGKKHLREALTIAAKHGLLDPKEAKRIDREREALRFEEANAPKPEEITPEKLDELPSEALAVLVDEAAGRLRNNILLPAEVREEAMVAQTAARVEVAGTRAQQAQGDRQQTLPDGGATGTGPQQDLAEESEVASIQMDDEQKRAFLKRAIELKAIGTNAKPEPSKEEMDERRENRDVAIDDGAKAAQVYHLVTKLKEVKRAAQRAKKKIEAGESVPGLEYDPGLDTAPAEKAGRGGAVDLHIDPKVAEKLVADLEDDIRTHTARSFLDQLHDAYKDVASQDHLKAGEAERDLFHHLAFGAADAINNHGQTILGGPVIDRQAIDTLGAEGAAQLMAWAVHQHRGDDVEAIHGAVGDYHAGTQKDQAEEAMSTAREAYETANELHQGMLANEAADLPTWHALNQQRIQHLHRAREALGRALGALESTAALHRALKKPPTDQIRVSLGQTAVDTAASQARAIGLSPDDYEIHHDGTNAWLHVKASGFPKLVRKVDPADAALHADMEAIKGGQHDEQGWLPQGFARRTDAPVYSGPAAPSHAEPFDYGLAKHGNVKEALASYIGQRVNDGWSPAQIHQDLLRDSHRLAFDQHGGGTPAAGGGEHPELAAWDRDNVEPQRMAPSLFGGEEETDEWRAWKRARDEHAAQLGPAPAAAGGGEGAGAARFKEFNDALDELLPGRHEATGTKQMAENWGPAMRTMAEEYIQRHRGGDTAGALHHQKLHPDHARDAAFRALARHPEATVAFKPVEELTHADREALRLAYHRYHARKSNEGGAGDPDERIAAWERANVEPERYAPSLFGGEEETEGWRAWKRDRDAAHAKFKEEAQADEPLDWEGYKNAHRGSRNAYRAMQDIVRGRYLADFKAQYEGLAGEPLKAGVTAIEGWRQHRHAMDPEWKEYEQQRRAAAQGSLQKRDRGKFAADAVRERIDKRLEDEGALQQRQRTAFDDDPGEGRARPGGAGTPAGHERITLGDSLEAQLADHVREHADLVDPRQPFTARMGITMDGSKIDQQRAVKAWLRAKRMGVFLGAGSGKTNVSFGAFGEARARGQARRGMYAVPSIVQGQFGSEALAYLEPGKTKWWAKAGAPKEERFRAYGDPGNHMVVVTHQALRDDVTEMVSRHLGIPPEEVTTRMTGYDAEGNEAPGAWSEADTDKHVADALRKHGADGLLDFMAVDEGHTALNRAGKRDSHMARVIDSLGRLSKHIGYMTGSPVKNDASEIFDQLKKVAPHKYGDGEGKVGRAEFLRRYGVDTTANRAALRRELGKHTFLGRVDPGTKPKYHHEQLPASEAQRQRLAEVETAYLDARRAQQRGEVDIDAMRKLSPGAFKDAPPHEHHEIAKRLQGSAGIIREAAYNHAINVHEGSAKFDRVAEIVGKHAGEKDAKGRPKSGVVFARNLDAVEAIRRRLESAGHKVVTLTGKDGADNKAKAKEAFQRGEANVIVLSDAGATGANLQRGSYLVEHDIPQTFMTWDQRQARINRIGQEHQEPDIYTLGVDHPWEHANRDRLERKRALNDLFFDGATERLDDSGLAYYLRQHLAKRDDGAEAKTA